MIPTATPADFIARHRLDGVGGHGRAFSGSAAAGRGPIPGRCKRAAAPNRPGGRNPRRIFFSPLKPSRKAYSPPRRSTSNTWWAISSRGSRRGMGMTRALASPKKEGAAQAETFAQEIAHGFGVRAKLSGSLDAEAAVAVKVAEGAGIKGTALRGLEDDRHVLVGREDADRLVDLAVTGDVGLVTLRSHRRLRAVGRPFQVGSRGGERAQAAGGQIGRAGPRRARRASSCRDLASAGSSQRRSRPPPGSLPLGDDFAVQPAPVGDARRMAVHSRPAPSKE